MRVKTLHNSFRKLPLTFSVDHWNEILFFGHLLLNPVDLYYIFWYIFFGENRKNKGIK